jgi:hypothetical protein
MVQKCFRVLTQNLSGDRKAIKLSLTHMQREMEESLGVLNIKKIFLLLRLQLDALFSYLLPTTNIHKHT